MFIEVYMIPANEYSKGVEESKKEQNRRLISIDGIRVRYSDRNPERCEILMPNGDRLDVVGTFDAIVERISKIDSVSYISATDR